MAYYVLRLSLEGKETAFMVLNVDASQTWSVSPKPSWWRSATGTWFRGRNATKFRQWTYINLVDGSKRLLARIDDIPFAEHKDMKGSLMSGGFFAMPEGEFTYRVTKSPPDRKYRIRETIGSFSAGASVVQVDRLTFEIEEISTSVKRQYIFSGFGFTTPTPAKLKLPTITPGMDGAGPWNEFPAPAWLDFSAFEGRAVLDTLYNVGLSTSYSKNFFSFAPVVDGKGYWIDNMPLNTGRSYALPSASTMLGTLSLSPDASQPARRAR